MYEIAEVDGIQNREALEAFNALDPYFPPLQDRHFTNGYWWLAFDGDGNEVAFAGMVPFLPLARVGYFKRCYVLPAHKGHGLQLRLMCARVVKARQLNFSHLVSECLSSNEASANNFRRAGFVQTFPEQPWAKDSIYWLKEL